jgi:predicted extracellular nuclease
MLNPSLRREAQQSHGMLFSYLRVVALLAVLSSVLCPAQTIADDLYVAFWNVENLFDLIDDKDVELDEEFSPTGPKKWTAERLEIKLRNLARVIQDMNDGKGPDVLGLSEIENKEVIELLIKHLKLSRDYGIVHQQSPSFRGIDCAIIYDKKIVALKSSRFHRIAGMTTRDIVEGHFALKSEKSGKPSFYVFSNHWPSRRSPDEARVKVAGVLRKRVDEILAKDKSADIIIVGDFNDYPDNISVAKTLNTTGDKSKLGNSKLFNAMWPLHNDPDAGTYVYKNKWGVLDHVVLSSGLFDQRGLKLVPKSVTAIFKDYQYYRPRTGIPRPSRSYSGPIFHANGYSDHLPIAAKFSVADR